MAELEESRPRRPQWALLAPVLVVLVGAGARYSWDAWLAYDADRSWLVILPLLALGTLCLAAAPAMALGYRFGWILAVTVCGWGLAFLLIDWYLGGDRYPLMALTALMAFLLHSPEMRAAYGVARASHA